MKIVTCIAPVNIATIKYWGKRDEKLILPLNDSISVTLSTDQMCAKTTVAISSEFESDRMWLNGKEQTLDNPRFVHLLKEIRKRTSKNCGNEVASLKLHICSENNFPTAAGLASSAAGYACLVYALTKVYKITDDISELARMGSGSACRSVYGGFVQWHSGHKPDGSDSVAEQLFEADHWPDLHIVVLVVNEGQKKVGSTSGMQLSVKTSSLLKYRVKTSVPQHINEMVKAIEEKNFKNFADVTMRDSNQMHATCLDTYPPIIYMNDISHSVVDFIHRYNKLNGETKVAYTFDAGPNACLFVLKKDVDDLINNIRRTFPPLLEEKENYIRGISVESRIINMDIASTVDKPNEPGLLKYILHTKVGKGPCVLNDENAHLLNENGLPSYT